MGLALDILRSNRQNIDVMLTQEPFSLMDQLARQVKNAHDTADHVESLIQQRAELDVTIAKLEAEEQASE